MNRLVIVLALSSLSVVQSSIQPHSDIQLQSVPDISSYGKSMYPQAHLHDLGEHAQVQHTPEVIKIIKTVKVEVPQPYPVHVPHKVPYPVQVKVPHIIKVPQLVKIAHPVPVEVVKHVPVHQEEGEQNGQYETSGYSNQDAYSQISQLAYGGGQAYGAQNYGPQQFGGYGGDQSSFVPSHYQGAVEDASQNYAVSNSYPSSEQQVSGSEDHTAQASSSQASQAQQQNMAYVVGAAYQVKDNEMSNQSR